ncbi:MAG TPA: CPBP family intramembrane glutamic endopeptidase [Mucilaginibacter sp.]|jgi:membrane protease YdiL (CAAX protease family)|nr:CPBP family intramembrane glutamic endopeptidase [Mucilaginibacter sp.]
MKIKLFVNRNPVLIYFAATFIISWAGSFLLVAPKLLKGEAIQQMDGLKMFPIMLLGPSITGICLTGILYGKIGLRELFSQIRRWRIGLKWYSALLIPPIVISLVLFILGKIYPNEFSPSYYFIGFLFGVPAGLLEEIGWTGFAFPHLQKKFSLITSGIILGLLWGLWHFPVIDSLGSASPHGRFLLPFFIAFILLMTAIRIIICRVYAGTKSVLLAQLFHISSTGFLVVLSPSGISPKQEVFWYLVYAAVLWLLIIVFRRKLFMQTTTNRKTLSESVN